jgi:hypothetical protein
MSIYVQETEDTLITPSPNSEEFVVTDAAPSGTSGGGSEDDLLLEHFFEERYHNVDLSGLTIAIDTAAQLGLSSFGVQARELVIGLSDAFATNQALVQGPRYVPLLHPQSREDGSILFEWILPNFRLGFGLEDDPSQSSWFLVSDETLGSINGYGFLPAGDRQKLFLWLINFLILHS